VFLICTNTNTKKAGAVHQKKCVKAARRDLEFIMIAWFWRVISSKLNNLKVI